MGVNSASVYEFNGLLHYPFPLSTGQVATLDIPKKLEAEDAERLAEFILTLAKGDE